MPTPVAAARPCLSPAAVTALDAAVASARRRAHAQTTSLHLISSLLAPTAPPLLRDALACARSAAYSPRLQLKALDLCFAVSLDRLPSSSSAFSNEDPPVSNSLMAAIKRSQANRRRNPDTFHFYHQATTTAQSPTGVKVDLSHLILAILDDPLVSRVFADAGFRNGDIKLAILRPAPPMPLFGRLPMRTRPPPLFLCSFAAADDADVHSHAGAGAGEENCRRIAEILSRGRNPMLVGVGAASAVADFATASPYRILPVGPTSVDHTNLGMAAATATSGLIISIGDLKELVPDEADLQDREQRVVAEVTRVLETHRAGRVWVMGWSATYETYLTFLSKFPLVDKDWELQLLPITAVRPAAGVMPPVTTVAALSKPATPSTSLMESFVPFGGLLCETYEANNLAANSCPQALRCQQCNDKYEQEVATIVRGSFITAEGHKEGLPSLLQNSSMMGPNNGFDAVKARDDQMVLNSKKLNLQKKWNEYCMRLHQGCQRINRDPYQLFTHHIGVPVDRERAANPSKGPEAVALQREVVKPSAVSASHTKTTAKSISSPSISNQRNEDLVLKFQVRQSNSDEHLQDRGVQSQHSNSSNCEDHMSPSSAASVVTDLVLGIPRESSSKDSSAAQCKHGQDANGSIHLIPKKVDDLNLKPPQLFVQPSSCSRSSSNWGQTSPSAVHSAASGGISAFGQWQRPSPLASQSFDLSNYKLLVERLFKAVARQEEALSAICESIVRCLSMERRRGANKKNEIWFSFHGPDSIAKWRVAAALAELMYGSSENLIYLDLSLQDWGDSNFRGKTGTDCIVEELRKKRRSVIFLDNIDKADCLVQESLSSAIETGRFCNLHGGRVVDLNDSIVVLSTRMIRGCKDASLGMEEGHAFLEEKVLAVRGHQLKILVEPGAANISGGPGGKVVVSSRHSVTNTQASLYSGSVSKRKFNISDGQEKLQKPPNTSKRLYRASSVPFDLNLPFNEAESHGDDDDDDSSSHDNSSGNPDGSVENLLRSVDESINFKPFDFGKLCEDMLQEFSNTMSDILGSECRLEIDVGAMEQILAAAWASDSEKKPVQTWLEHVFARSLEQLKLKCKNVRKSVLRLVACEDALLKDDGFGALLPSRIILD
ncbi:protein DWARF 53-like [Phragmites australis]|uniref:protein DWARF 53-like n=1 Tax=Phragmites australis TaxID=29695 RepID=UPI002D78C42A|nr:protein DWARF 53-like [Phragmites australis]